MYGIPNCDTIKKARLWLAEHDVPYLFHNYKKEAPSTELLASWVDVVGWELLLNKRGTTWRKLAEEEKQDIDAGKAIALMSQNPSMIKRPVLIVDDHIEVGFSAQAYNGLLT